MAWPFACTALLRQQSVADLRGPKMEGFLESAGSPACALSLGVARTPVMPPLAAGTSSGAAAACTDDCSCGSPASSTASPHTAALPATRPVSGQRSDINALRALPADANRAKYLLTGRSSGKQACPRRHASDAAWGLQGVHAFWTRQAQEH